MYVVLALLITVALLSGPILSEDEKKSDNVVVLKETKTSRKRNEFNPYAEIGRALAEIVKEIQAIIMNFLRQVREPADKVGGEVKNLKSSLMGKKDSSDNIISGFVGLVKDARSVIFKVLHSLTAPAESMGNVITNHLERSVPTDQHLKDLSLHVGYEDVSSESDKSDSYSFFYEDTTHIPSNISKSELVDLSTTSVETSRKQHHSFDTLNYSSSKAKIEPKRHSEEFQKSWKPMLKMNKEIERGRATKRYSVRPETLKRHNGYLSLYNDYETLREPGSLKKRFHRIIPKEHLTHSQEYERKWRPLIKRNRRLKPGKRLLGGRPQNQKPTTSTRLRKIHLTSSPDVGTLSSKNIKHIEEDASRLDFEHLVNSLPSKTSAPNSLKSHEIYKHHAKDINAVYFDHSPISLQTRKSLSETIPVKNLNSQSVRKKWSEEDFKTVAKRIGLDQHSSSTSKSFIILTPKPESTEIMYEKVWNWQPSKKKEKSIRKQAQDHSFGSLKCETTKSSKQGKPGEFITSIPSESIRTRSI